MPFAIVRGTPVTELPQDLYIPPDALEVFLETFQGPLDLLLYLIRRQNLDILDIPIFEITKQYVGYIEALQELRFELAAEYLVMAAILAEIKSRMLLPRPESTEEEEEDPRAELVRRLQEYERFKLAAEQLEELPRQERDFLVARAYLKDRKVVQIPPDVELQEMLIAFAEVLGRADLFGHHHIQMEPLSVRERMTRVMQTLSDRPFCTFRELYSEDEGRMGVVVTFLAVLELLKGKVVDLVQNEPYGPIYVKNIEAEGPLEETA